MKFNRKLTSDLVQNGSDHLSCPYKECVTPVQKTLNFLQQKNAKYIFYISINLAVVLVTQQ